MYLILHLQVDRRAQVDVLDRYRLSIGARAWRNLLHCLIEMNGLFGPFGDLLCKSSRVCILNTHIYIYICLSSFLLFS